MMKRTQIAVAVSALFTAHGVFAQQPSAAPGAMPTIDKVQVTGSRINLTQEQIAGIGPVTVIDAETIQRSGAVSLETLLQRLPASAGFGGNQTSAYWVTGGWGTAQINLRGLGVNRTLVLLNGRRLVNGGSGANISVDLNMIPVGIIERIEVLKDGASAVYGADAVAGVVNIITKTAVDGGEITIRYGETSHGDGDESNTNITMGLTGPKGSMMAALNYAKVGVVPMASRAPCGLGERGGALVCVDSSATLGGRALLANGTRVNFNNTYQPITTYQPYVELRDNYNANPSLNAVNPVERVGFSVFGTYNLNADVQFFTELLYSYRKSDQLGSPATLGATRTLRIAADHPTNPTGQALTLERRRVAEVGGRNFFQEVDTFRVLGGFKGTAFGKWDWNAAFNWGRSNATDGATNIANLDRVDLTLDRTRCSTTPGAAIPCGNYLGYGNLTREVMNYVMATTHLNGGNDQKSVSGNATSQVFNLPAGPVGFATGFEVRRESGYRLPDPLVAAGIANQNREDPIDGDYTAKELYAEFSIPVLARAPFAQTLNLNLAGRYSNYDLFDATSTYKAGLDWQVVPEVKVRANYSTAFRVPSIPELFGGRREGNLTTTDPCSNYASLPATSVVAQNCRAGGVPATYRQLGNTVLTTTGGNPALEPEDAKTLTVGFVLTPIPSMTLTFDYFDIKINDAIQSVPGSTKLSVCYNSANLSHPFCDPAHFTRNPATGEITYLSSTPVNAASERVTGMDFGGIYAFTLAEVPAVLNVEVSRLSRYEVVPFQGAASIIYDGKTTGGRGTYSEWRAQGSLTGSYGPWSGTYGIQYIGKATDINAAPTAIGYNVPAVTYHNVQVRYAVSKSMDLAVGVDNLFDKEPPYMPSYTDANTDTMTYDLLGRRWHVRLAYRF